MGKGNTKKEGGETPLTDEEKAALGLTEQETNAAEAGEGKGGKDNEGEGNEGEGNEGEGNDGEGSESTVETPKVLEILNRFGVDECFETSDGSIFLSKNLAMLHTAQDAKKVKTHERKDFE